MQRRQLQQRQQLLQQQRVAVDDNTAQVLVTLGVLATGAALIITGNADYLWLLILFIWLVL